MAVKPLGPEWVDELCAAAALAKSVHAVDGVVEFTRGKTTKVLVKLADGRFTGSAVDGEEPVLSVPLTSSQLEAFVTGAESMSRAYTRGDFKPVGATGPLLAVFALFDDEKVRGHLTAAMEVG